MRNVFILGILAVFMATGDVSYAQSGSRGGSSGGGNRSGGASRGGGGFARGGGGFSGGSGISRAQRERLAQQQQLYRQQQLIQAAQQQAEFAQQQREQYLVQLGQPNGKSVNQKQLRIALNEAKKDFLRLRKKQVTPEQLGSLRTPFRLDSESINRPERTVSWPAELQADSFATAVQKIDKFVSKDAGSDPQLAVAFLNELLSLNVAVNAAAASGTLERTGFSEARRFLTGLANEVRSDVRAEGTTE